MKTAIILFNLGGPDCFEAIRPFLFNLFNDKAIIGAPGPIRWMLARYISGKRAPIAREIYAKIGGRSPLVPETEAQARALEQVLGEDYRCFIAMRYWHPFTREAVAAVKAWGADQVVILPLYPQFSTTTTGSSLKEWRAESSRQGLNLPTRTVCCFPTEPGLIAAMADLVRKGYLEALSLGKPRILFSAHGLPKSVIERGDPYQAQVEMTAAAVAKATGIEELDWSICYQSRVGPMEWIGPSTEVELERAGHDRVPVVVVPVAFVSEHSETLVELDMEYRHRADAFGIPAYIRVPALGCHSSFITGLAELVRDPASVSGVACRHLGRGCAC
ncbi:MAG: ferrochelatase [Phaeospirillum sp.]|nr:ferrochelatase [Phaeospirillum sp.]